MAEITDVAAYICDNYPIKSELSKARLTKLVYLADWLSAKEHNHQITNIKWYFDNYGPYVKDVINSVEQDNRFKLENSINFYGQPKTQILLKEKLDCVGELTKDERRILDQVIEDTRVLYWDSFIKHVYSTKPIRSADRYSFLDLVKEATE